MGRILEDIFRSLNNLLERFHQSYFFYLLPSSERFISIGLYMPAICLIAGALFVKACGKWCQLQQNPLAASDTDEDESKEDSPKSTKLDDNDHVLLQKKDDDIDINLVQIGTILLLTHIVGVTLMNSPSYITKVGSEYGLNTELSLYLGFAAFSVVLLISPTFVMIRTCYKSMTVLNILSLLELGTVLICLSMYNFSLGLLAGTLYVPLVLLINPSNCRMCSIVQKLLWLAAHPLVVLTVTVIVYTFVSFLGEPFKENLNRGFAATQQAVVFSIVDSMIYSNWLYNVITCILVPNWLCFWCVTFGSGKPKTDGEVTLEEKKNN